MKNNFFLKFTKIRNSRNSQNYVWKTIFLLGKLYQKLFSLHSHYTGDTKYRIWFGLDNSLIRWKRILFKILKNSQFAKFRMNNHFFLGKLYQHFFLLYTIITMVILNTEFGLIWTTPWPDGKELFLKFSKIRNSRNSPNSVCITIFS